MAYLNFATYPWLTLLVLSPVAGMLLVGFAALMKLPNQLIRTGAVAWSLIPLGIAVYLYAGFAPQAIADGQQMIQFVEKIPWTQVIRVDYFLGIDGLSLPMVVLTALITPIAILASFSLEHQLKPHIALLFLLEAAMLGYFVALDFFFFFLFWEVSLVPAFFLILAWGNHPERRRSAAFTFFVYTLAGSIGMLLLFGLLYAATAATGQGTFNIIELARLGQGLPVEGFSADLQTILFNFLDTSSPWLTDALGRFPLLYAGIAFWAVFIAFAIKLAIWPFHTWLPDAYAEAPTAGAILLAAVMSKMGAYGMLRVLVPFFPHAAALFAPLIGGLALIGVLVGAFGALAQARNPKGSLRRLIAQTSINHMGYVGMAVAALAALQGDPVSRAIAINGATMQMVAHGLSTAALFLLASALIERTGSDRLNAFGGLRSSMPILAGVMGIAVFANLGLPSLAGFVGEFLIMRAVWAAFPLLAILATIGLVVTAIALLEMYGTLFHGRLAENTSHTDIPLGGHEFIAVLPLIGLLLVLGIYPALVLDVSNGVMVMLAR